MSCGRKFMAMEGPRQVCLAKAEKVETRNDEAPRPTESQERYWSLPLVFKNDHILLGLKLQACKMPHSSPTVNKDDRWVLRGPWEDWEEFYHAKSLRATNQFLESDHGICSMPLKMLHKEYSQSKAGWRGRFRGSESSGDISEVTAWEMQPAHHLIEQEWGMQDAECMRHTWMYGVCNYLEWEWWAKSM